MQIESPSQAVKFSLASNIFACYLLSVSMGMMAALLPVMLQAKGFTESLIGILLTFETIAAFSICFALPAVIKYLKMRLGIVLSALIRIVPFAILVMNISSNEGVFWASVIFLVSLGTYGYLLLSQTWVNALPISGNFGLWMAIYSTSMSIGIACGPFLLNVLDSSCSQIMPFLNDFKTLMSHFLPDAAARGSCPVGMETGLGVGYGVRDLDQIKLFVALFISLIATVPLLFTIRFAPKFSTQSKSSILNTITRCKGPMFAIALAGVSFFGVAAFITVYGVGNGLDEKDAILLLSAFNLGSILLEIPLGWLSDRVDRRFIVVACSLLCATCAAFLPMAISEFYIALSLVFLWGGVIGAIYSLALALIGERFEDNELIAANAGYSVMEGLGGTFGIILIGFSIEQFNSDGLPYVIMLSSVLFISFAVTRYKVV